MSEQVVVAPETEQAEEKPVHVPEIKVRWLRSQDHIAFSRPRTILALGTRGSGKSSLLEVLALRYPKIIDIYSASDDEGLCWCKAEFVELFKSLYGREPNILLVIGKDMDVASKWDKVRITELKLSDFEEHDVIITVLAFHSNETNYFATLNKITTLLWEKRRSWREPWYVLVREASNWIYSRLKTTRNDMFAKAAFIKALREARHHGLSIGIDTLRWTSLDKEIRDVSDYVFIKQVGSVGLPDDLRWLYRYFRPYAMMQLRPEVFGLITGRGAVGFGKFTYPKWHKEERENILKSTHIEVKRIEQTLPDDARFGVGDFEHSEIIIQYMRLRSMRKVASALSRSSRTVNIHINRHNSAVERTGECTKCHHSACEFSKDHIEVSRR